MLSAQALTSGKIDGGRGVGWNERECAVDEIGGKFGDLLIFEELVKSFFLEGGGKFAEGWEMNSALRIEELKGVEVGACDFFKFAGAVPGSDEAGDGVVAEDIGEEGKGFVTEAVAGGEGFGI